MPCSPHAQSIPAAAAAPRSCGSRQRRSWSSRGLLQGQTQLVDHLLAHQELLDLAGDGHREAVDEFDIARHLVMGDLALAESADLLGCRNLPVMQAYPGAELLAIARVGDPNYLHILDLGVPVEELLDLSGIDVLVAAYHHVFDPANDIAITLDIDRREVAGMHPPACVDRLAGLLLVVPIASSRASAIHRPCRAARSCRRHRR